MMFNQFSLATIKDYLIVACVIIIVILFARNEYLKEKQRREEARVAQLASNLEMQNKAIAEWKEKGDDLKKRVALAEEKTKKIESSSKIAVAKYMQVKNKSCDDAAHWAAQVSPEILKEW